MHFCALFGHFSVQIVLKLKMEVLSCVSKNKSCDRQENVLETSSKHELYRVSESRDIQKV